MHLLPELTPENRQYWTGGANGELLITHCASCSKAIHPPELICPHCLSRDTIATPALGTGIIYSFTVNYQQWLPGLNPPYVIVVVDLDGELGVRVTGELKNASPEEVAIGLPVTVCFQQAEDIWIPQFLLEKNGG